MNARYEIVQEESSTSTLVIRDVGPWDKHKTVTNDVEAVIAELYAFQHLWPERTLLCYDSMGNLDEILHADGNFCGFRHRKMI